MAEELLRALGAGAVHVLAHDVGDTVAQELLARANARQAGAGLTGAPYVFGLYEKLLQAGAGLTGTASPLNLLWDNSGSGHFG